MDKEFDYTKEDFENVPCCICGISSERVICSNAQGGLKAKTRMCCTCGLVFISPRMTSASYDSYYGYHYRHHRSSIKKSSEEPDSLESNFNSAYKLGQAFALKFSNYVKPGLTIDVGSSTGGVLSGLSSDIEDLDILGFEPSIRESEYALTKGIKTERTLFENSDLSNIGNVSNIFCVKSLNHLLDPVGFVERSRDILCEGGHLFIMVKNFRHQVYRMGKISSAVQIDHPYMFTPRSLIALVEKAGLEVVYLDNDEFKSNKELHEQKKAGFNTHHIILVARKSSPLKDRTIRKPSIFSLLAFNDAIVKLMFYLLFSKRTKSFHPIIRPIFLHEIS